MPLERLNPISPDQRGRIGRTYTKSVSLMPYRGTDGLGTVHAYVYYDDDCGNGHKTLSITGDVRDGRDVLMCGRLDGILAAEFPELRRIMPWHLCSEDGPLHYIENAMYWAGHRGYCDGKPDSPPNLKHLASTIIYPHVPGYDDVPLHEIAVHGPSLEIWLNTRLLPLLDEFSTVLREFGFEP